MPRFSRISWKSRDDAEPPRMPSRSDAAKRRRSERAIPGAPRQTLYCSVSLRVKRRPGGGAFTSGGRARGGRPVAGGRAAAPPLGGPRLLGRRGGWKKLGEPLVADVSGRRDHDVP